MNDFAFSGVHVVADVYDIAPEAVTDDDRILTALTQGVARAGATLCGLQTKAFHPNGMTALLLLSESHVSVHTYPDHRSLFFDAFTCGARCTPEAVLEELLTALGDCRHRTTILDRGDESMSPYARALVAAAAPS